MKHIVVVYHVKTQATLCFDGFCSATLLWKKFGDSAEYLPIMYHQDIPVDRFIGREVYFVDFSFDVERMDRIAAVAESLLVLDHHAPKADSFKDRPYAFFSENACGASMVWKHFYSGELPAFIELIDDGDRFLNIHPDLNAFNAALSVEPVSLEHWSNLIDRLLPGSDFYTQFLERGAILENYDLARISTLVRDAFPFTLCGMTGLAVNSNKFYSHRTATKLAEHSKTFGAVFYVRADGNVEVSLRRVDPDIDVQKIAATFGGGGHVGAAAFAVSITKFKELLHSEGKSDLYTRIESVTKSFAPVLNCTSYKGLDWVKEEFLRYLQDDLGSNIADYLDFDITESVGHPGTCIRLRSTLAEYLGLQRVVTEPRWYHALFPYIKKREVQIDDDVIRDVLLESCDSGSPLNAFLVNKLLETVNVTEKLELITSIYYLHITVHLPGSKLTVNHSFEVCK